MSRQTERIVMGILGFTAAVLALFAGMKVLVDDSNSVDSALLSTEAESTSSTTEPAAPSIISSSTSSTSTTVKRSTTTSIEASTTAATAESTTSVTRAETTARGSATSSRPTTTARPSETSSTSTTTATSTTAPDTTDPSNARDSSPDTSPDSSTDGDGGTTDSTTDGTATSTTSSTTSTTIDGSSTGDPSTGADSAIENEIISLTNALRADPDGNLRRQAPMPACVEGNPGIEIDPGTGHPRAVPALTVDSSVGVSMARDWSAKMAANGQMTHRPAGERASILQSLGISYSLEGENVAWAEGYEVSEIAWVFFSGWRESNSGHYCALLHSEFTHFGVGHYFDGTAHWGTQNFYAAR